MLAKLAHPKKIALRDMSLADRFRLGTEHASQSTSHVGLALTSHC